MKRATIHSLDAAIWAAQWIVAGAFNFVGMAKLGFTGEQAGSFFGGAAMTTEMLHTVGMVEIALSLATILPAVLRILPQLSTVAAGGLAAAALLGTMMPASAAGTSMAALNLVLAAEALFVVWGRSAPAPIAPFAEEADSLAPALLAVPPPRAPRPGRAATPSSKPALVNPVATSREIARRRVVGERLDNVLHPSGQRAEIPTA